MREWGARACFEEGGGEMLQIIERGQNKKLALAANFLFQLLIK